MQQLRPLTPNQLKELDDYIRESRRMGPRDVVTHAMRVENQNKIIYQTDQPRAVTPQELDARAKTQRNMDAQRAQLETMERERAWNALTPDQQFAKETEYSDTMLVELTAAKLAKARSLRQYAAAERYELELEQRQAKLLDTRARVEALNRQVEAAAELRDDVDYQYALTCAKSAVDVTDRGTEAHTRAQIHLHELETATPQNVKQRMTAFNAFDSERLAARVAELRAAEHAAIVEATPKVNEALELGRQAAETALQQHNATRNVGAEQ